MTEEGIGALGAQWVTSECHPLIRQALMIDFELRDARRVNRDVEGAPADLSPWSLSDSARDRAGSG